jgi:regulator of cell morphogenesis and NO signaling
MQLASHQTVSEIAAGSLSAVRVFEQYGIDYCCGGNRPLEEVCLEKGLTAASVLEQLEAAAATGTNHGTDWNSAPLRDLIRHIVTKHHGYLKMELPRIAERLQKVMRVYGVQDAAVLAPLPQLFKDLRQEMEQHMHKEEVVLFPFIERYEACLLAGQSIPPVPFGSIANPIRMMEREHDSAGDALRQIRESTNGYAVPAHACITYRSLLDGLREMEEDLHMHIHLENNILFPRAIAMENR